MTIICGIYRILNLIDKKSYIGSSKQLNKRQLEHLSNLKKNKHCNPHLQYAYNKYKKISFVFEVLLYCSKEDLDFYEAKAISVYKTLNSVFGYNVLSIKRCDLKGDNLIERNKKISETLKGRYKGKNSPSYKNGRSVKKNHCITCGKEISCYPAKRCRVCAAINKPTVSKETRQRMSKARKGKYCGKHCKHAKPVIINRRYFNTRNEAAEFLNVDPVTIKNRIDRCVDGYNWA